MRIAHNYVDHFQTKELSYYLGDVNITETILKISVQYQMENESRQTGEEIYSDFNEMMNDLPHIQSFPLSTPD